MNKSALLNLRIREVMKNQYHLEVDDILEQEGGWASLAFRIQAAKTYYFLKVYEKDRASTAKWTALIDLYIPIVRWLSQNRLKGRIVHPIPTIYGANLWEDQDFVFLLFDYLEGKTIGKEPLDIVQVRELAETISVLHGYGDEIPFATDQLREDFSLPFLGDLKAFWECFDACSDQRLKMLLTPYQSEITQIMEFAGALSAQVREEKLDFVLCHTDLHTGNMMQTKEGLILIDWEGLKLAPPEADLFMLMKEAYFDDFFAVYQTFHPGFQLCETALSFYRYRRKLEDIWELIEQLCCDEMSQTEREDSFRYLTIECETLDELKKR